MIDRLTALIPERFLKFVRFGALFVWVILAAIVTFTAYGKGSQNVPAQGQDLSLANIMERVTVEENRKKKPGVVIPDTGELLYEKFQPETPSMESVPRAQPLLEENRPIESAQLPPFAGEKGVHIFPGQSPPVEGLKREPDSVELLPLKEAPQAPPAKQPGTVGPGQGKKIDLLPID